MLSQHLVDQVHDFSSAVAVRGVRWAAWLFARAPHPWQQRWMAHLERAIARRDVAPLHLLLPLTASLPGLLLLGIGQTMSDVITSMLCFIVALISILELNLLLLNLRMTYGGMGPSVQADTLLRPDPPAVARHVLARHDWLLLAIALHPAEHATRARRRWAYWQRAVPTSPSDRARRPRF